jgi:hypothetical protein
MARSIKVWSGSSWEDVAPLLPTANTQFIQITDPASKGLIIRGASSQTANLVDLQNISLTTLTSVDANGNMAIGTAPSALSFNRQLTINAGSAQYAGIQLTNTAAGAALNNGVGIYTSNNDFVLNNWTATGNMLMATAGVTRLTIAPGGTSTFAYPVVVNGSITATSKSFEIDHPTKPDMRLRYGSLEGPENGVYVRGISTDSVIELPDYWTGLVDEDTITVNLTPVGFFQPLFVDNIKDNKIYVAGSDVMSYSYIVFAERKDIDKLEVEF